ncbi:MAG: sigma-70 family RNA polymerase sigma factor [Rhizobiaceae bacterium]|nr:sigma-70 family RNA polymerase sigma factor [Rhizobiaceae bacterium]
MRTEISGNQSDVVALIPALRGFARTFYRNRDDADDLVQETLMKAIGAIDTFKEGTQLKSWLFTIMRNTFYTKVRKQRREPVGEKDIATWPISQPTQEWSQRGIELQAALERLPESQREVIVLIGVLGVSYEEAAGICNCEMGTIKSRLNRARTRLAFEMGETSREAVNQYDRAGIPA